MTIIAIIYVLLFKFNKIEGFENGIQVLISELKNNSISSDTNGFDVVSERETKNIPKEEITLITTAFMDYYNTLNKSNFFILEMPFEGIKATLIPGKEISKKYTIPLFIYEKDLNYLVRLKITVTMSPLGKVTLILLEEFKEIKSDTKLLPPYTKQPIISDFKAGETEFIQLFTEDDQKLEDTRLAKIAELDLKYTCLGIPGTNTETDNKTECEIFGGVFDRPVKEDSDCPFYKANKNYDNIRGGAKNGFCEMPSGVSIKGYRFYDKNPEKFLPQCYNCKDKLIGQGTIGTCCADQSDTLKYPGLKSPDYRFSGDTLDRPKII